MKEYTMKPIKALLIAISFCIVAPTQAAGLDGDKSNREVFKMGLYPPDIIMRHQQQLGITNDQRSNISRAVKEFQSEVAELQWTMQNEQQLMRQSFSGYPIPTEEALTRAERVLGLESEFKLAHFRLLIATKNELTEKQIDMINKFVKKKRGANPEG
jgi:hypothetical protein